MKKINAILSGGGTGGHIFPAIAIANAIKEQAKDSSILFVGAVGKMEMEKVPQAGYPIVGLWISGFQRKLSLQNLLLPFKIMVSFIKALYIIKTFKPHVVIGTGGYASWAIVKAANSLKIPTIIQEQNSYPGKSNLNLAKQSTKICVAYPNMEKFFPKEKIEITGNPVRQDIQQLQTITKQEACKAFNLNPNNKVVLVIGGSLGARTINLSITNLLNDLHTNNIQLIWQTGKNYFEEAKLVARNYNGFYVSDFIKQMNLAYAAADVIISRAGAISISEICVVQKPAILIPSPNVTDDHQTKNAVALADKKAALVIKDNEATTQLKTTLFNLLNNPELQQTLINNIKPFAYTNAAEHIAQIALKIARL